MPPDQAAARAVPVRAGSWPQRRPRVAQRRPAPPGDGCVTGRDCGAACVPRLSLAFASAGAVTCGVPSWTVSLTGRLRPDCGCFTPSDRYLIELWLTAGRRVRGRAGDEVADVLQPGVAPVQVPEAEELPVVLEIMRVRLHRVRRPADVGEIRPGTGQPGRPARRRPRARSTTASPSRGPSPDARASSPP